MYSFRLRRLYGCPYVYNLRLLLLGAVHRQLRLADAHILGFVFNGATGTDTKYYKKGYYKKGYYKSGYYR